MLKINIQNLSIRHNIFFSYKKIFLFFYFFKKIITISYYNVYLNFLKFSFFKTKNNIDDLNTDNVTTDNLFKNKNKLSTEFIKMYSLLTYTKNNWNSEILFFNTESINKNISFFFEKYKLQEMAGSFGIKKNHQYGFYNYFFFNLFVFFNSIKRESADTKKKPLIKKLFYCNLENVSNKLFSIFMFSYFNTNFNNLKNIHFISFLNNFLSRNRLLSGTKRINFFKQTKTFHFYRFLKNYKKLKKKKKNLKNLLKIKQKHINIENFNYSYFNNGTGIERKLKIKKIKNIDDISYEEDTVFETNSLFSNISLDYADVLFEDFYLKKQYSLEYYYLRRLNKIKNKSMYYGVKDSVISYKNKNNYFFKYDDNFFIFKRIKSGKHADIGEYSIFTATLFFELSLLYKLNSIYEFNKYNIFEFIYLNDRPVVDFFNIFSRNSLKINNMVFKKKNAYELNIDSSFFFNFLLKRLFIKVYKQKKFYVKKKLSYLRGRLGNFYKDKIFFIDNVKKKKNVFKMFRNRFIQDYKIKKELKRYNSRQSFISRIKKNVSLFFSKKSKKYNNVSVFFINRYVNVGKKIKTLSKWLGFIYKLQKKNKDSFFVKKNFTFFKKKYTDVVYFKNSMFRFSFFNLTNFDKNKIINKYKYWYSFFNSWNWTFLFINNFYNFESKLDYHELRASLMYQQNKNYHNNYFFIDNSKTFKDYRFIKEKDRDHFESNLFYNKLTRKNILSRKVNSNVFYKERVYKNKLEFYKRIKVILVKNHHSKTLRRERLRVNYFFKLNYRFQHRLTNWLYYYKLNYGLSLYYNFNLTLVNTLSNSKFIPDSVYIIFLLKRQLIFLNGYCVIGPKTNLFRGDCISLKINWYVYVYLIYIKKIYKYNNIIIKSFLKNKFKKYKSDNPKNWNHVFQSSIDYDVPYYTEIDYMTLSCIVLFEPDYNYIIKRNFYNLTYVPLLSLFNLNWKYVV